MNPGRRTAMQLHVAARTYELEVVGVYAELAPALMMHVVPLPQNTAVDLKREAVSTNESGVPLRRQPHIHLAVPGARNRASPQPAAAAILLNLTPKTLLDSRRVDGHLNSPSPAGGRDGYAGDCKSS